MHEIVISYRHDDAPSSAHRLYGDLATVLGDNALFMDRSGFTGMDVVQETTNRLRSCVAQIVVIGPRWRQLTDPAGRRRLERADDLVRLEISVALSRGISVIPVLVENGVMPGADELPAQIRALADIRPIELREESWASGVVRILATLDDPHGRSPIEARVPSVAEGPDWPPLGRDPGATDPLILGSPTPGSRKQSTGAKKKESVATAFIAFVVGAVGLVLKKLPTTSVPSAPTSSSGSPDLVRCSVFAPANAQRGESVFVQVFAHLPVDDENVKALAKGFDSDATARGARLLDQEVPRGSQLSFCLSVSGTNIHDPVQKLTWRGIPESVQFEVNIPKDYYSTSLIGTVIVSQDGVPIGHVKFVIHLWTVGAGRLTDAVASEPMQHWKRYRKAFISYASADRAEVLKRVQMLQRVSIDFFQDLLTLEPGERWAQTLYKKIDESDVFFLFWSTAANRSEWVMKEVRYAIQCKGGDEFASPEIVPVIIEGPPPVAPPSELAHLHFNDRFIYFISASE